MKIINSSKFVDLHRCSERYLLAWLNRSRINAASLTRVMPRRSVLGNNFSITCRRKMVNFCIARHSPTRRAILHCEVVRVSADCYRLMEEGVGTAQFDVTALPLSASLPPSSRGEDISRAGLPSASSIMASDSEDAESTEFIASYSNDEIVSTFNMIAGTKGKDFLSKFLSLIAEKINK